MHTTQLPGIEIGTFIDPMNDFGFKTIFGSEPNKEILIDLLNELLQGRKVIADLIYNKNESRPPQKEFRGAIFDLTCTDQDGAQFLIEMQKVNQPYFKDRAVYYTSSMIHEQGPKGMKNWDFELKEVFFIGLMDFQFEDSDPDNCLNRVRLHSESTDETFYDKLEYIFIEIPKFDKTETELETNLDQWLFVLKNMSKFGKISGYLTKRIFQKLFKIAEVANLSKEEYMSYERSLKAQWDEYATREGARRDGLKEGLREGLKEGEEIGLKKAEAKARAGQEKTVIKLLKLDLSDRKIADILDVSEAFVQQVKENHF